MPRQPNTIPSKQLNVAVPLDLFTKLAMHLYSKTENRVPYGEYNRWISARINEYFAYRQLDLAPYAGCDGGLHMVSGPPATLEQLRILLEKTK